MYLKNKMALCIYIFHINKCLNCNLLVRVTTVIFHRLLGICECNYKLNKKFVMSISKSNIFYLIYFFRRKLLRVATVKFFPKKKNIDFFLPKTFLLVFMPTLFAQA